MTTLRDLTWRDLPTVAGLESALFGRHAWSEPTWWAELAGRPRREYVAAVGPDGSVQGYAGLDHGGESADIMTVAVDPRHRGAGVGRSLVDELIARAQRGGAVTIPMCFGITVGDVLGELRGGGTPVPTGRAWLPRLQGP